MYKALSVFTLLLILTGCQTSKKGEAFPAMYAEKPVSLLVVPSINQSTAADAPDLYSATITVPLANAGFYVLPIAITEKILQSEGLSEGMMFKDIPPQKFSEFLGSDAVLYVTIEKWDTNYYVLGGDVTVKINYILKSSKTGQNLWNFNQQIVLDTSSQDSDASFGLAGLLVKAIVTAVQTAAQDYVPVAHNVNVKALQSIPFGKYHKLHNKDQGMTIPTM
jgi:hypothetical protein